MPKRKSQMVVGTMYHNLKGPSIEQIDGQPNANDQRRIGDYAYGVLGDLLPTFGHLHHHKDERTETEEQE